MALVRVGWIVVRHATVAIVESNPLDGLVLCADVDGILLAGVGAGEDIADVVEAVDLVQAGEGVGAPDRDEGIAGTGYQERPGVGGGGVGRGLGRVGVGGGGSSAREEEPEDMALVGLYPLHELKGAEGPDDQLAVVGASKDILVGHGECEDRAVVLELLDADGGIGLLVG